MFSSPTLSHHQTRRYIQESAKQTMTKLTYKLFDICALCQLMQFQPTSSNENKDQLMYEPIRKQGVFIHSFREQLAELFCFLLYIFPLSHQCLARTLTGRRFTIGKTSFDSGVTGSCQCPPGHKSEKRNNEGEQKDVHCFPISVVTLSQDNLIAPLLSPL